MSLILTSAILQIILQILKEKHPDINKLSDKQWTLLHDAVCVHQNEVVDFLIRSGIDLNRKDNEGNVPIMYSINRKNEPAFRKLLSAGSDVNIRNDEAKLPIHVAAESGFIDALGELAARTNEVNTLTPSGRSALDKLVRTIMSAQDYVVYIPFIEQLDKFIVLTGAKINRPYLISSSIFNLAAIPLIMKIATLSKEEVFMSSDAFEQYVALVLSTIVDNYKNKRLELYKIAWNLQKESKMRLPLSNGLQYYYKWFNRTRTLFQEQLQAMKSVEIIFGRQPMMRPGSLKWAARIKMLVYFTGDIERLPWPVREYLTIG
ncbi:hypothetical protein ACOME3_001680 [Neoechinorhynchus agilis]